MKKSPAKPMKEQELRELAKCANCGKLVGKTIAPIIFKITAEVHYLDAAAINRQTGVELMTGHPALAQIFSANEDMTRVPDGAWTFGLCVQCAAFGEGLIARILEVASRQKPDNDTSVASLETTTPG